jgi:hypothetical protein
MLCWFSLFSFASNVLMQVPMDRSASRCLQWSHGSVRAADCKQSWREWSGPVRIFFFYLLLMMWWNMHIRPAHLPACRDGNSPLEFAIIHEMPDVVAMLRSDGASQ